MSDHSPQPAAPTEEAASPRSPMLTVVNQLVDIAADVRVDAQAANTDGDRERREYLMGEHRGLMEAAEVLLSFDWESAWRETCAARPTPVAGKEWLYRSPADGAEVRVRFNGTEWQNADPHLPARWYSCGDELLEWPGIFTELETGLPR